MNKIFFLIGAAHTAIFLFAVVVPAWIYIRWRQSLVLAGFLSFLLYVLLVNVYFWVGGAFGIGFHPFFNEAHEVGWAVSIVATLICCKIAYRIWADSRSEPNRKG